MKGKTLRKSTFVAQILKIIQFQFWATVSWWSFLQILRTNIKMTNHKFKNGCFILLFGICYLWVEYVFQFRSSF
jgi:hypothetical protein